MKIKKKTESPAELVQRKLEDRPEVRPFPAAVTQLLSAIQNPDSTSDDLAQIIECDPALAVRLLRMANSPLYGLTSDVRSVSHAASVLGIRSLKTLAMSVAGASMFSEGKSAAQERLRLWDHSLGTAAVTRTIATFYSDVSADDGFLASIFHDVGKLFLYDVVPDEYAELNRQYRGDDLIEQEKLSFGVTHEEIGLASAHHWNLAEELKMAIGYHHRPDEALAHMTFVQLVHDANELARVWAIGSDAVQNDEGEEDLEATTLDPTETLLLERLEVDAETLIAAREQAQEAFAATQQVCA